MMESARGSPRNRRRAPPVSQAGSSHPLYRVWHIGGEGGGTFFIEKIWRALHLIYTPAGVAVPCVRYARGWQPLHDKRELPALMKEIRSRQYDRGLPRFKGRIFSPGKDERLPFIREWEEPIAAYATFGRGGL